MEEEEAAAQEEEAAAQEEEATAHTKEATDTMDQLVAVTGSPEVALEETQAFTPRYARVSCVPLWFL